MNGVSSSSRPSASLVGLKEISPPLFYQSTSPQRPSRPHTLKKRADQLEHENKRLRSERYQALANGVLVYHEFSLLKHKANIKSNRALKKCKLNAKARCLTSAEGFGEAREADRLRLEKERNLKREESAAKRTTEESEDSKPDLHWILSPDTPFTGALSSKNKSQLRLIHLQQRCT